MDGLINLKILESLMEIHSGNKSINGKPLFDKLRVTYRGVILSPSKGGRRNKSELLN